MADVQIAIIDQQNTQIALAAPPDTQVTAAVPGVQGPKGEGVPTGGTANQVLFKQSGTNYDTAWGAITSAMIGDLQIVDGDVSTTAAIAGTKISPNFGAQNVVTTGTSTAASFIPTSSTVPTNGVYLPAANSVAISTNGTGRLFVDANGNVTVGSAARAVNQDLTFSADTGNFVIRLNRGSHAMQVIDSVAATTPLTLDSSGRLGLGTSSPGYTLDVVGVARTYSSTTDAASHYISKTNSGTADQGGNKIYFTNAGPAATARATDTLIGAIQFQASQPSSGALQNCGAIEVTADGTQSGSNTPTKLQFSVGGAGLGAGNRTVMTIDSSQRVGIGTTSPVSTLHVVGSQFLTGGNYFTDTTSGYFFNGSGGFAGGIYGSSSGNVANIVSPQTISFGTASSERARIDSSGRLLVGTSSGRAVVGINAYLQVEGSGSNYDTSAVGITRNATNAGESPSLVFGRSRGTSNGAVTAVTSGDRLGSIAFAGANGTDLSNLGGLIDCYVDGTVSGGGANDMPGRLVFSTTADGASSPTEACIINSSQQLLVNTNASIASFNDGRIEVASKASQLAIAADATASSAIGIGIRGNTSTTAISFFNASDGATCGTIVLNSGSTSYNTSSDYRLKENVTAVTDGITRLQQLKPSRFNFIADPAKTVDGFIAHEVQTIVPEAITGEKDAVDDDGNPQYQGIDQSKLVPLLTAALQEAIGEIESLKARVAVLEAN